MTATAQDQFTKSPPPSSAATGDLFFIQLERGFIVAVPPHLVRPISSPNFLYKSVRKILRAKPGIPTTARSCSIGSFAAGICVIKTPKMGSHAFAKSRCWAGAWVTEDFVLLIRIALISLRNGSYRLQEHS